MPPTPRARSDPLLRTRVPTVVLDRMHGQVLEGLHGDSWRILDGSGSLATAKDGRFLMGLVRGALPGPTVQRLADVLGKAARSGSSNRGAGAGPIPLDKARALLAAGSILKFGNGSQLRLAPGGAGLLARPKGAKEWRPVRRMEDAAQGTPPLKVRAMFNGRLDTLFRSHRVPSVAVDGDSGLMAQLRPELAAVDAAVRRHFPLQASDMARHLRQAVHARAAAGPALAASEREVDAAEADLLRVQASSSVPPDRLRAAKKRHAAAVDGVRSHLTGSVPPRAFSHVANVIQVNVDHASGLHVDADDAPYAAMVVGGSDAYQGGLFVVPRYRAAARVRPGDLFVARTDVLHGNTQLRPHSGSSPPSRVSMVLYVKKRKLRGRLPS